MSLQASNVGHHVSSAPSSLTKTPPGQQRIPQRSLTSDDMTRERVLQQPPRQEYLVPLPTPMPTPEDLMPHQRRLIPAEPRHAEPRSIEPRPEKSCAVETRAEVRGDTAPVNPYTESRQVDQHQRRGESRQVEQRYIDSRSTDKHHTGQHVERSLSEQRGTERRHAEPRSVNHYHGEYRTEQRPAESNHVRQHAERRPADQFSSKQHGTEQRPLEPRQIEPHAVRPIAARVVQEVPGHMGQPLATATSLEKVSEIASKISTATPSRQVQEGKRKAADIPTAQQATMVPSSKRPRTRDRSTDEELTTKLPMDQSPRGIRQSSGGGKEPRANTVKRTIPFQEVYQDGKAQYKHKIFSWPKDSDNWYIVRCDEHQVHFNNGNPIHGAAKHVHSPQHGHLEKRHDLAMEICGHLVVGCNAELAELNNREFERALKEDKYQVFNMNLLTKEGRRRLTDGPALKADDVGSPQSNNTPIKFTKVVKSPIKTGSTITKPEECKFYLGFWAPTKKWYMLIVLPIRPDGSLREVGLKEKLQQTDLMSNVPKCYRSDRISLRIIGWQPAYSDGGAKADKREYPVMFFDSPKQKHSVGWLPATKLRPVDLFNPPDDADKKGLAMARDWYAIRMMHRKDWEQFKRLGPGEPPSPSPSEGDAGKSEHWTSLRSAHIDDMSPIRDKSNGPGHFFGSGSSDEGSDIGDTDDPMTMDVGPIPEPADSNYVEEDSGSEDSDVDMDVGDAARNDAPRSDVDDAMRPGVRNELRRPSSRRSVHSQEVSVDEMKKGETTAAASKMDGATQSNSATASAESESQNQAIAITNHEHYMRSAQAKAAAAVKEAATRSRASSENSELTKSSSASPIQQHQARPSALDAQPTLASQTTLADPSHTSSETLSHVPSNRSVTLNEAGNDLESHRPHKVQQSVQADTRSEEHVDPYKRFEAIRAQMIGLSSRPASVPVNVGTGTDSPFGPPPQSGRTKELVKRVIQQLPTDSHIMSPPLSQSSAMIPARSSSTTPTNGLESGRNTPKIVIPEDKSRWKIIHNSSSDSMPQSEATSASKSVSPTTPSLQSPQQPLVQPTPQLGTPIHDKQETFDVSQFDGPEGLRWAREGPNKPFLRLTTDAMRKWAEAARDSGLKATIEPAQVQWIETDHPEGDRDKQRVKLRTKDNREMVLLFETNSANGRSQKAALQGRKFVSWVKRINEKVEWRDE